MKITDIKIGVVKRGLTAAGLDSDLGRFVGSVEQGELKIFTDEGLECGDRIVIEYWTWALFHIPARDAVMKMIQESGMVPVEDAVRSEPGAESDAGRWLPDCRMGVVPLPV